MSVAQAEDVYDLMNHIAWTDVIRPRLEKDIKNNTDLLISEALGTPIANGQTREQVAGMCYGIKHVISIFEEILRKGERAVAELNSAGISLNK